MLNYFDLADFFIADSSYNDLYYITNLKLQKLMYYTQAWHLAIYGKRLFDAEFESWRHGPVIVDLFNKYKHMKFHPIVVDVSFEEIVSYRCKFGKHMDFIDEVLEEYMPLDTYYLEQIVKEKPWLLARNGVPDNVDRCSNIICDEWMRDYYSDLLNV